MATDNGKRTRTVAEVHRKLQNSTKGEAKSGGDWVFSDGDRQFQKKTKNRNIK